MTHDEVLERIKQVEREGWTKLNLFGAELTKLPSEIGRLTQLTQLVLGGNRLRTLPPEIGELTQLTSLNLSSNLLTTLPPEIGELTQLTSLNLYRNNLTKLPPELGRLTQLTSLQLFGNQLTTFQLEISLLTQLTWLNLAVNLLTILPPEIGELTQLTELYIGRNKLETLSSEIGRLTQLASLGLANTKLTTLPSEIGRLTQLRRLYLYDGHLMILPQEIQQLTKLEELYLHGNLALNIPLEILGPTWLDVEKDKATPAAPQDILRYYFVQQQATPQKSSLNEAKLLLLGQGGVGKTSLVKRLVHDTFDKDEAKTEGIHIEQWSRPNERTPDQNIRVNIWDFGGQEIMHATHQFFLTQRSLYLIVLKSRRDMTDNRLDYWLQMVKSFGGNSPVLVIINQIDQHEQQIDTRFYEEKYNDVNIIGWHATSCLSGAGVANLREAITNVLNQLDDVHTPFASSWFDVKAALERMTAPYISRNAYRTICRDHGVTDESDQDILLRFMHRLGIALHFGDDHQLVATNVLNPKWVTTGVYRILNDVLLSQARGVLTHNHLQRILADRAYDDMHTFIVHIMRRFELCFPYPDNTNTWLIPDLVTPIEPYTREWDDVLRFRYRYPDVLPPSVITRFITRMNARIPDKTFWRSGTLLRGDEGNLAHVRADHEAQTIDIRIAGQQATRRVFLAIIRDQFARLHATIPNLKVEERVPLPNQPKIDVSYAHLMRLEQRGELTYLPEGAEEAITVADLLNGVEDVRSRAKRLERELRETRETEPVTPPQRDPVARIGLTPAEHLEYEQLAQLKAAHDAPCRQQARWVRRGYGLIVIVGIGVAMWLLAQFITPEIWSEYERLTWIIGVGMGAVLWFYSPEWLKREQVEAWWCKRCQQKAYATHGFDVARYEALQQAKQG